MHIERLFLDEAFSTLDPETLDIALDALEGLRQGNKSIGVISHVGLLNPSPISPSPRLRPQHPPNPPRLRGQVSCPTAA